MPAENVADLSNRVAAELERDPLPTESPVDAGKIASLAALPLLEYDRRRDAEAKDLGVRVGTLDRLVAAVRVETGADTSAGQALQLADRDPWPEPVEGAALLTALATSARRYLVLPKHADTVLALWVVFTYCLEAAHAAPILAIVSPEKRCGKSTLLDWLARLVQRPLATSNILPAALFRSIEKWRPTLLIDEADTFLKDNEELRGILNSGHTRGSAYVIRTVGDEHEPRQFSTWGAKAISLIGKLPDTLADRAIAIEMRRKLPAERVHKLRGTAERDSLDQLARQCARFAADSMLALRKSEPNLPDQLNDRAADSWAPLLAIAHVAEGDWPNRARATASVLTDETPDGDSLKVELLRDIWLLFDDRQTEQLSSSDIVDGVAKDVDRPWCEFNRGKQMTPRQLARLLSPFNIVSNTVRFADGKTLKGYRLEDFKDAFARYLPGFHPSQRHKPELALIVTDSTSVTLGAVLRIANSSQASIDAACNGVTDRGPPDGADRHDDDAVERFE
jgi:putative DNA primase/helicase